MENIDSADLQGVYSELAEIAGIEVTEAIYTRLKGQQITFPTRLFKKSYVIKEVNKKYNGANLKELAREFDYSERWIRTFIQNT